MCSLQALERNTDLANQGLLGKLLVATGPHKHQNASLLHQIRRVESSAQCGQLLRVPHQVNVLWVYLLIAGTQLDSSMLREINWTRDPIQGLVIE